MPVPAPASAGFCRNLKTGQRISAPNRQQHPPAEILRAPSPRITPGKAPTSSTPSAPSHWEGDAKKRARNPHSKQKFLDFKSLPPLCRRWDWAEGLTFDLAGGLSICIFMPPLNRGGIGISVKHYSPNLEREGKFAAKEVINYSTFTLKTTASTKGPG